MTFAEIWSELEKTQAGRRDGILRRRIFPESKCDLFLGLEFPSKGRCFLVRVRTNVADRLSQLPRAKGFEFGCASLADDGIERVSYWLRLTDLRYSDVFSSLAEDIATSLSRIADEGELVETFISRLRQWQSFLDRLSPEGLSEEAQKGLFGELYFLKTHLLPAVGGYQAVAGWKGPLNAVHDFQLPQSSIEIKTTTSKQHERVVIAGERQLDTTNLKTLLLVHISLYTGPSLEATLPEIIQSIRELLAQDALSRDRFDDLLRAGGYLDVHATRYEQPHYSVRKLRCFEVREGFPRLTAESLPPGVGDLVYTIMIDQCLPFQISENQMNTLLRQIV